MTADYLQWPGQPDDSILVSDYLGQHSVPCHKHHFVEIVMNPQGIMQASIPEP